MTTYQQHAEITPDEQAVINRRPNELSFQPSLACLICGSRLVRFCFGDTVCARCEPGALWSDETMRLLSATQERGRKAG